MVRFSTAMALFGVQQLQNAVDFPSDSKTAIKKIHDSLDSVTSAIATQLDDVKRPAVDSISGLVDKTRTAFDASAFHPNKVVETATEAVRKTADTLGDALTKAAQSSAQAKSDEPVLASTIRTPKH